MDNHIIWPGWETVRKIGSGGCGTVYEIQRNTHGHIHKAALKVITVPHNEDEIDNLRSAGLDDASITQNFLEQVENVISEYNLMLQMRDNPNIVHCDDFREIQHDHDLGWDIYLKMELLTPIMKCLDQLSTEEQIIQLGKDICSALVACQEENIIHRDIKPENVFRAEKGHFKLGDFGIARTMEHSTRATAGIGTYSYMAPEVKKGETYGKTVDIYSLGLVLYWLLNYRRGPFIPLPPKGILYSDLETALQRRLSGERLPPPAHGSDALKDVVLKACSYAPRDRYQTAAEMLQALRALDSAPMYIPHSAVPEAAVFTQSPVIPTPVPEAALEDVTVGIWNHIPQNQIPTQPSVQETKGEDSTVGIHSYIPKNQIPAQPSAQEVPMEDGTVSVWVQKTPATINSAIIANQIQKSEDSSPQSMSADIPVSPASQSNQNQKPNKKPINIFIPILIGVGVIIVILILFRACGSSQRTSTPAQQNSVTAPVSTAPTKVSSVTTPQETEPKATEETLPEGIMTHAEFDAAALDSEVTIHTYVQAVEGWWDGYVQVYAQSKDGGYYIYNLACTEEDAAKLVPGTKIEVTGYKAEWSGEVEIIDATYKILEGSWKVETANDVTALMGTDDLAKHMNELVAVKGLTVAASTDADGNDVPFLYKWDGSGSQGDDIYFNVELNSTVYTFTVNVYMIGTGADSNVYKAVEGLKIGDKIDVEGFLYWYNAPQPHVTSVKVAG